jgi:hypothetical protein
MKVFMATCQNKVFYFFLLRKNSFCPEAGWGREVAQIMYEHLSKIKNDKI